MKRNILLCVFFLGTLFLSGCATTGQYVMMPDQNVEIQDPSKARIYVLRPAGYFGSGISMVVKDGDREIGNTKGGGRYLCWEREPGIADITSQSENKSRLSVNVEAGRCYYILQSVEVGFFISRNRLSLLDEDQGKKYLRKCKPAAAR